MARKPRNLTKAGRDAAGWDEMTRVTIYRRTPPTPTAENESWVGEDAFTLADSAAVTVTSDPTPDKWMASGGSNGAAGTYASPWATLAYAITQMSAGQTLGVKNGTISGQSLTALPVGNAGAWCTIIAETDGGVTWTGGVNQSANTSYYCRIIGFLFSDSAQKSIVGKYQKWQRCGFKGGAATGNATNTTIGSNDFTPGAHDMLFEDCWWFGGGGRYKALVYNGLRVVLRRCVGRHDAGWTYDSQNPAAVFVIYDSQDCAL